MNVNTDGFGSHLIANNSLEAFIYTMYAGNAGFLFQSMSCVKSK